MLVYDSGVGGLQILKTLRDTCLNTRYFYFADYLNMPFGNKPVRALREAIFNTIACLVEKLRANLVVLACNTATSVAIALLRARLPNVMFVGVEPAIKFARDLGYKRVLLLATPNTIKFNPLVRKSVSEMGENLILSAERDLASDVENNLNNLDNLLPILVKRWEKLSSCGADCVVLGCTHYLWIRKQILQAFSLKCIDGVAGVVKRFCSVVERGHSQNKVTILTNDKRKEGDLRLAWQKLNSGGEYVRN